MPRSLAAIVTVVALSTACGDDGTGDSADRGSIETDPPTSTTQVAVTTTSTTAAPSSTTTSPPKTSTTMAPTTTQAGASFGQVNAALPAELMQSGYDGPFFMVNLIEFRDQAVYADGRETDLTGAEANDLYGQTGVRVLIDSGMRPALQGHVLADPAAPTIPAWDQVAIARYPSYREFFSVAQNPEFQDGVEHKDAGVASTTAMVSLRVVDAPPAAELPAAEDPVVLFELFSHDGNGVTDQPEPLADYLDGLATLATGRGGIALGSYEVQGAMIGDGREWDEAHLWWFADRSELEALLADPALDDLIATRDEALTDHYRLVLDGVQVEPLGREP